MTLRAAYPATAYLAILEALAVGDALGAPTEFMTRAEILGSVAGPDGLVEGLVEPSLSKNHPDLGRAQVTDDTEQNAALVRAYLDAGSIDARATAEALLAWVRTSGAVEKRYIGPSSLKALAAIESGEDPEKAGLGGTTCGGVMRSPSAALCAISRGWDLPESVRLACLPTHNTSTALEAATAYAYALRAAMERGARGDGGWESVVEAALAGAEAGKRAAPYEICAASTAARLDCLRGRAGGWGSPGELLDFLYGVLGAGLESEDVAAAVFGIFMYARDDAWLAIRMGASLGGDTDTVAALTGALCAAYAGGHRIPRAVVEEVIASNGLALEALAGKLAAAAQAGRDG